MHLTLSAKMNILSQIILGKYIIKNKLTEVILNYQHKIFHLNQEYT